MRPDPAQDQPQLTWAARARDGEDAIRRKEDLGGCWTGFPRTGEWITRCLGCNKHWREDVKNVFGAPHRNGSGTGTDVLGARACYRTVLMGGDPRPLKEFRDRGAEHDRLAGSALTSTSTDAELELWATREEESAARQG